MAWLLCDYGEVLSLPQPAADKKALEAAAAWDRGRGDFWDAYWRHRVGYDRADVTVSEYWSAVLGRPPAADQLQHLIDVDVAGWLHPNRATLDAIDRLKGRQVRLAILSNAPVEVAQAIRAARWLAPFTEKFFSCWLRAVKPEPAAYETVVNALGVAPEDVFFVDDRPTNVSAAAALGLRAELFEGPDQFDRLLSGLSEPRG
jgi:putative hydrolase of the HAD superfamily